jgi:hypothetical protein
MRKWEPACFKNRFVFWKGAPQYFYLFFHPKTKKSKGFSLWIFFVTNW